MIAWRIDAMAGHGRAPKDPAQRRNRVPPSRGEWVTLPHVTEPILPALPDRPKVRVQRAERMVRVADPWSERTIYAWDAWRRDPATTQYGPAEVAAAIELAFIFEDAVRGREKNAEVRLRMDGLGLSAKGKRDLRWRAPTEVVAEPERPRLAEVRRLRAVDPRG